MEGHLNAIEICAGAGGQALGLERAGFEHKLAIELDHTAAQTLKHNRKDWDVRIGDVADSKVWEPNAYAINSGPRIDLFAGGVPCPPFSIAGQQRGSTDERDLFAWAIEQVGIIRPRAVLLENVRGLSMPRFAGYRQHVLDRLDELGYQAEWRLLNSSDFGLAQLRPRFVLVAMEPDDFKYFHWPLAKGTKKTVGQELGNLMSANGWEGARDWQKAANGIAPTIVGGSKKHGGADLGPTRAKKAWAELGVDGKGIANDAPMPGDTFDIGPRLTLEMVARLQGWDDKDYNWEFCGKKTSVYRQIGNAFPPPVAHAIGNSLRDALNHKSELKKAVANPENYDFIYSSLKRANSYMTIAQILRDSKETLEAHTIDQRITMLGRDFEIFKKQTPQGLAYKLGEFKGFIGQQDHQRHEYFLNEINKVS